MQVYGQFQNCSNFKQTNPSFPSKSITVTDKKCSPPKIRTPAFFLRSPWDNQWKHHCSFYSPLRPHPSIHLHIPLLQITFVILKADHFHWLWTVFEHTHVCTYAWPTGPSPEYAMCAMFLCVWSPTCYCTVAVDVGQLLFQQDKLCGGSLLPLQL